ncbi:guanine nucleotide exchange factor [Anaeramoeba flamelloides]|nr:guanine nucleotide exchange factor [Anaeramoeba flamelloides]
MINQFNFLADCISSAILSEKDENTRVIKIIKCIKIANELEDLKNFNDMFAVVSGLQNTVVSRLEKTWKKVPKNIIDILSTLDNLTDVLNGCKQLKIITLNSNPPLIPYLGSFLIEISNNEDLPNTINNNLIHWKKKVKIWETISQLKKFQNCLYDFFANDNLQILFNSQKVYTESEMWEKSCEIEKPPNMN